MKGSIRRRSIAYVLVALLLASMVAPVTATAQDSATPEVATPATSAESGRVDLDVLFIGAHPDDEASRLSTYGQWNEYSGLQTGVITITRGEGGGNAVGQEEGAALGLLREVEERDAVGLAGVEHIYNLDKVDFYYTVSAPLSEEIWDYDDTLERIVRVIRATSPEVIVTMNPAPTPGNHGHHQSAAKLAIDAYEVAGDPSVYPEQIEDEGLPAWAPGKVFTTSFAGESVTGESCATDFTPTEPTDVVYGVWAGQASEANGGVTWAQVEQESRRVYASQGWSVFPDAPTDPAEIGCDFFTLVDSRVPYTIGNSDPTAPVEGALTDTTGGLPAGTTMEVDASTFSVSADVPFTLTTSIVTDDPSAVSLEYRLPEGWTSAPAEAGDGEGFVETVEIIPSMDSEAATRYRIEVTATIGDATGQAVQVVELAAPVEAALEPLPQVAQFRDWVAEVDQPQLDSLIKPVLSIGVGETRSVDVTVTNTSDVEQTASVTALVPAGFELDQDVIGLDLSAGEETIVTFEITNVDTALPTANEGGTEGDYLFDIRTVASGVAVTEIAGINLVPVVSVPAIGAAPEASPVAAPTADGATPVVAAEAPVVDGAIAEGEYASGPLDLSRVWEGDDPDSAEDGSGTAYLAHDENGLYIAVEVTDEALGTILPEADAKRHWRTDSVEIAIDPLGTSENTSSTFKVGIFPVTEEGGPAAYRDADNFQGPIADTAPGMEVASTVSEPYTGYVIETFIPYDALPAGIDPEALAMNIFIYDSDTQDLTGQTRLGWSVYGGVQGDPYRWGHVTLEGYTGPEAGEVAEPQVPLEVAESVSSPWSIIQSAEDGVGLAGLPPVSGDEVMTLSDGPTVADGVVTATVTGGSVGGTVRVFAVDDDGAVLASQEATLEASGTVDVSLEIGDADPATVTIAVSLETEDGRGQAVTAQP